MQVKKDLVVYLPKSLLDNLNEKLQKEPPKFKYKLDYFVLLINYIINLEIKNPKKEFQVISKQKIKKITVSNIDRYIAYLKNGDFLICDNSYQQNVKSYHYKLNEVYFVDEVQEYIIIGKTRQAENVLKKIKNEKAHYNRMPYHLRAMQKRFNSLKLDYENAYNWVENNSNGKAKIIHLTSLKNIEDKRFRYFKRNKTNYRLDTNLTSLKSELRKFMVGDFISIDLKNSQPVFLSAVLFKIINNTHTYSTIPALCPYLSDEKLNQYFGKQQIKDVLKIHQKLTIQNKEFFIQFYNSVKQGELYEQFMELSEDKIERNKVKKMMFTIFYSRNWQRLKNKPNCIIPYEKEKEQFLSVYPFVGEATYILKRKDHRKLSIYLQQFESYVFIDCIAKELVENGIIPFTIHDSVIIEKEHKEKALKIIKDVFFREVGTLPSFKIEKIQ